ncbi:NAD(P)/FAD-dependent oxidoreductase [Crocinitomix algicola]|uniref:NAD(P)/FAD-dependent oxidoreductase n=1 Tax=Crocinitomix algicola TaxID=1740263 RepID=UPI000831A854|nr:FAD-binding oxidoreductase [Crocinitomix algicola]
MQKKDENVIVGWGLAGAVLAWTAYFKGRSFRVFDSGSNHCTRVAAGLVNPIIFKRLTKSWNVDKLMPFAGDFYEKIQRELEVELLSYKNILRVLRDVEEENDWAVKVNDPDFKSYMGHENSTTMEKIYAPNGFGKVKTFGNLKTGLFLDASKRFFINKGVKFIEDKFSYANLNEEELYFFCEGAEIGSNPFFNYLPMKPTHGEVLIIRSFNYSCMETVNKNLFILPIGDNLYKIGSTYNWELNQPIPTKEGKDDLLSRLKMFANFDFEIVDHQAGIRPTVADRRPLVGMHPKHKNVYVFNGLGTKGVMIAPYYGKQFLDFVFEGGILDDEVNIRRYSHKYISNNS